MWGRKSSYVCVTSHWVGLGAGFLLLSFFLRRILSLPLSLSLFLLFSVLMISNWPNKWFGPMDSWLQPGRRGVVSPSMKIGAGNTAPRLRKLLNLQKKLLDRWRALMSP